MTESPPAPGPPDPDAAVAAERAARADRRDAVADERDRVTSAREQLADLRDAGGAPIAPIAPAAPPLTTSVEEPPAHDDAGGDASPRDWAAEKREFVADESQRLADLREALADEREAAADRHQVVPLPAEERRQLEEARIARSQAMEARTRVDEARRQADLPRPLAQELLEVSRALSHRGTLDESLQHVVEIAQRVADHCDAASYTQKDGDGYATVASTNAVALGIDEAQYRAGEGPCVEATDHGQPVSSPDIGDDPRWPSLTAELAATVARSAMSTPVADDQLEQVVYGSLNHYGPSGDGFDSDDIESAMLLGAHLGALLSLRAAHDAEAQQLREAIVTRDIIGQAKGILMTRQGIDADEAFDILRRASRRLNRKLREVAADVTAGSLDAGPEDLSG